MRFFCFVFFSSIVQESKKVITKLESDKTTLVAKRHLMRVIFGDYRKLMHSKK